MEEKRLASIRRNELAWEEIGKVNHFAPSVLYTYILMNLFLAIGYCSRLGDTSILLLLLNISFMYHDVVKEQPYTL